MALSKLSFSAVRPHCLRENRSCRTLQSGCEEAGARTVRNEQVPAGENMALGTSAAKCVRSGQKVACVNGKAPTLIFGYGQKGL